ncbi:MAG: signal recognition particle-docking protein FtsY [Chloroflexota bacterium]
MLDRFRKLDKSIRRSQDAFFNRVVGLFEGRVIDDALWEELEELLVQADLGFTVTTELVERVRERVDVEHVREAEKAKRILREEMVAILGAKAGQDSRLDLRKGRVNVILVVGVNGTGKTTTIAKLSALLKGQGHRVLLAAADTFRAAAIDQLRIWGERVGVPVIAHQPNADPGAVVFDALQTAPSRGIDVVVVDTAGRIHTKFNLMEELKKIRRVIAKLDETAPHEVLLVLDATTGQNALSQARHFTQAVNVTGLVVAKLDGTAKGGIVFAIAQELGIPIKFVGTGEQLDDLAEFDAEDFVNALLKA